MVWTVADARVRGEVRQRVTGITITTDDRCEGSRAQHAAGGDGQGSCRGVGRDDGAEGGDASAARSAGARMTRSVFPHVAPRSCTGWKPSWRTWRQTISTVWPRLRRRPTWIIPAMIDPATEHTRYRSDRHNRHGRDHCCRRSGGRRVAIPPRESSPAVANGVTGGGQTTAAPRSSMPEQPGTSHGRRYRRRRRSNWTRCRQKRATELTRREGEL